MIRLLGLLLLPVALLITVTSLLVLLVGQALNILGQVLILGTVYVNLRIRQYVVWMKRQKASKIIV